MQTHPKKKVEIILEAPLMRMAIELIERLGATGYTVVPALAGRGADGYWQEGEISGAVRMVMIVVITSAEVADRLLDELYDLLSVYTAIVYVSDVAVVRQDHF